MCTIRQLGRWSEVTYSDSMWPWKVWCAAAAAAAAVGETEWLHEPIELEDGMIDELFDKWWIWLNLSDIMDNSLKSRLHCPLVRTKSMYPLPSPTHTLQSRRG